MRNWFIYNFQVSVGPKSYQMVIYLIPIYLFVIEFESASRKTMKNALHQKGLEFAHSEFILCLLKMFGLAFLLLLL